MQTKVIIENGEVTLDALDGQGQQCRKHHASYVQKLRDEFGLPADAVQESCKPEMAMAEPQAQTMEGEVTLA